MISHYDIEIAESEAQRLTAGAEHRYRITKTQGPYAGGSTKHQQRMYCWLLSPHQQTEIMRTYSAAKWSAKADRLRAERLAERRAWDASKWTPKGRKPSRGRDKVTVHKGNREAWAEAERQRIIDSYYRPSANGWSGD